MEWLLSLVDLQWIKENYFLILLTSAVGIEWIMIQALLIHVMLKKERVPQFRRERAQIIALEKLTNFQATQIERLYAKLGEMSRDITTITTNTSPKTQAKNLATMDRGMLTMGELSLKKRLTELTQQEKQKTSKAKTN